jgi:hypothetical protein
MSRSRKSAWWGIVAAFVVAPVASAASITWGSITQITGTSSLSQTGTFVTAVNLGGNGGSLAIGGTDITFSDGGVTAAVGGGGVSNSGNGGFYSPATGDTNLDAVLDSHSYISGNNPNGRGRIDLSGLAVGQAYQVQVIGVADDRACCGTRTQTVDDGLGNTSAAMQRSLAQSTIGTFTADATTQSFFVSGANDPGLSAFVVRAVPEPAAMGVLALGAGMLVRRRARRN